MVVKENLIADVEAFVPRINHTSTYSKFTAVCPNCKRTVYGDGGAKPSPKVVETGCIRCGCTFKVMVK